MRSLIITDEMVSAGFRLYFVMAVETKAATPGVAKLLASGEHSQADNAYQAADVIGGAPSFGNRMRAIG